MTLDRMCINKQILFF
uniref:Uncharacterized protein n=1 Tax=Anguilla anguilla TaxID=7936 RepID=A0A0E9VTC1_ANGAN